MTVPAVVFHCIKYTGESVRHPAVTLLGMSASDLKRGWRWRKDEWSKGGYE